MQHSTVFTDPISLVQATSRQQVSDSLANDPSRSAQLTAAITAMAGPSPTPAEVAARLCPGMPPPGPNLSSEQTKAYLQAAIARRSALEVEVKEAKHVEAWLGRLLRRVITRELCVGFGEPCDAHSTSDEAAADAEPTSHEAAAAAPGVVARADGGAADEGSSHVAQRPRARARPADGPSAGSAAGPAQHPAGRARANAARAPPGKCQACYNLERGRTQSVSHSRGRDGTECKLKPANQGQQRAAKRPRADPAARQSPGPVAGQGVAAPAAGDGGDAADEDEHADSDADTLR